MLSLLSSKGNRKIFSLALECILNTVTAPHTQMLGKYFLNNSLLATLTSRIYYLMDDSKSINFCTKVFK